MIPYAPLVVALFRLFRQAAWRNIRSVSMLISSVRRAFQLLWRRKGDLSRRGGASAPNTNAEGDSCSWQPTIFAASQDLSPGVGALLQDSTTSNDIEHLDAASVVSPHHSSLNATPGDAPTFDKGSGADSASPNNAEPFHVSVSPGSHSLEPAPEGPSISDKDNGTSTYHPTSASEPRALALSVEIPGFRPIVPTDIRRRADRHGRASPQGKHDITIPPGVDRTWMMGTAAPVGWGKFAHPEGTTYFRSLQQTAGAWVFTYANLGLPEMLETITHFLQSFKEFLETYSLHLREGSELVLDLEEGSGNLKDYCGYYVKVKGTVYWFDEFKAMDLEIWKTVLGVTPTHAHIELELRCQSWYHDSLFPNTRLITRGPNNYLRGLIIHALYDVSMSEHSTGTAESTAHQLTTMLQAISSAETQVGQSAPGSVFVVCRSTHIRLRHKLMTSLFREQQASGPLATAMHTYTFRFISPMLFYTPEFHLRILRGMYEDTLVYTSVARETLQKLNEEWQDFVLNAAVLLNANIALLTIQSVDGSGTSATRSPIQVFSYVSMAMSTGSIVLGLLLVRQTRTKTPKSVAASMLAHSIQTRAILYSLPYALLMWAMLTFGGAFTSLCFIATNSTTRAILAVVCAIIITFIFWCIVYTWEEGRVPNKQDTTELRRGWLPTFRRKRRSTHKRQAGSHPGWWPMLRTKGMSVASLELPVTQPPATALPDSGEPL